MQVDSDIALLHPRDLRFGKDPIGVLTEKTGLHGRHGLIRAASMTETRGPARG